MDPVKASSENRLILALWPGLRGLPAHLGESQENRDLEEAVLKLAHSRKLSPIPIWPASKGARFENPNDARVVRILWDAGFRCLLVHILPDEKGVSLGRKERGEGEEDDFTFDE